MAEFAAYSFFNQQAYFAGESKRGSVRSSSGLFILNRSNPFVNGLFSIEKYGNIAYLGDMNENNVGDVFTEGTLHTDGLVYLLSRAESQIAVFDTSTNIRTSVSVSWGLYGAQAFASDSTTNKLYVYLSGGEGVYEITPYGVSTALDIVGSRKLTLPAYGSNITMWVWGDYFVVCTDEDSNVSIYNISDFSLAATTTKNPHDFQILDSNNWYYLRLDSGYLTLYHKNIGSTDSLILSVELPEDSVNSEIIGATLDGDYITCALSGITSTPIIVFGPDGGFAATATPTITPESGSIVGDSAIITIACATEGAIIRYTLDGTEPTALSQIYEGPFLIEKPVAFENPIASTADILDRTYNTVKIGTQEWMCDNLMKYGDAGRYALDPITDAGLRWQFLDNYGALYTESEIQTLPLFDGWHRPSQAEFSTLLARVVDPASLKREDTGEWYTEGAAAPWVYPNTGATGALQVYFNGAGSYLNEVAQDDTGYFGWFSLADASTYLFSYDGTAEFSVANPDRRVSVRFVRDIAVPDTVTVRAIAFHESMVQSSVADELYGFTDALQVALPTITPESGTYEAEILVVTIACATVDASIYYTVDGTTPTAASNLYAEPLELTAPFYNTVSAVAVLGGYLDSSVASQAYILIEPLPPPVFTPPSGTYADTVIVSMSAEGGASIWYHIEGTPETDWFVYITPLTITETTTIAARAEIGSRNSLYAYATYSISLYQKKNSVLLYDFAFGIST